MSYKKNYFLLICLIIGSSLQALGDGSCEKCLDCRTNGKYSSCFECYKSKHEITTAMDGKCTGDSTGISNCLAARKARNGLQCTLCEEGYGIFNQEDTTTSSTTNGENHLVVHDCRKITIKHALKATFYYDTVTSSIKERVIACKPGYVVTLTNTCAVNVDASKQIPTAGCVGYGSGQLGCALCENKMVLTYPHSQPYRSNPEDPNHFLGFGLMYSNNFVQCIDAPLNAFGVSVSGSDWAMTDTVGEYNQIVNQKWTFGKCNGKLGFVVGEAKPYGWNGAMGRNPVTCKSEEYGNLGGGTDSAAKLISGLLGLVGLLTVLMIN